jgi:hypothetical protein
MAFMLKIQWDIKNSKVADFKSNQESLCKVMLDDHPGVICYHVDYPSEGVSEWTEIYATDDAFRAHLANEKGKSPLAAVIEACDKITCRCFGDPDAASRKILEGFRYHLSQHSAERFRPQPPRGQRFTSLRGRHGQANPHNGPRPRRGEINRFL